MHAEPEFEAVIVGAGAAGMMTAAIAGGGGATRLALLEGTARAGTKILVSGGGRCNVTNRVVKPSDFHGPRDAVARVLRRFDADAAARFFARIGVELKHEPEFDKMFPVTDDAHTVRDALERECARVGCPPRPGRRVEAVRPAPHGFDVETREATLATRRVVLATGGRSMPRTGSDGHGWVIARALGHTVGPTVPALVPLVLQPNPFEGLAGNAFPVEIRVAHPAEGGRVSARVRGPLLLTHFGVSGPAALDVSRHWSAAPEGVRPSLLLSFFPGTERDEVDRAWRDAAARGGAAGVPSLLGHLPLRVAKRIQELAGVPADRKIASLAKDERRRLLDAATALPLPVRDTRGFNAAEVTAGGVPLGEVDVRTMESRVRKGLHLVGEILDVEGRIGGFNFQWAWATAFICGQALAPPAAARETPSVS
ncbi:MAG: hypothetical protein HMLKMBBP_01759 [Planctomycetes bacterium]|nr:hypothetical protein [Planctomycetota bacterium]